MNKREMSPFGAQLFNDLVNVARESFVSNRTYEITVTFTVGAQSEVEAKFELAKMCNVMKEYNPKLIKDHKHDLTVDVTPPPQIPNVPL